MSVLDACTVALVAATLLTTGTDATVVGVADADSASCAFRETAVHVLGELRGDTSPRGTRLRHLLVDAGVGDAGFVPDQCRNGGGADQGGGQDGGQDGSGGTGDGAGDTDGGDTGGGDTPQSGSGAAGNGHCPQTAAGALGWGTPNRESQFNGSSPDSGWSLYDGPGHAGNGRRTPDAVSVADGILTITGNEQGDAEGMAWNPGQKFGRWELCVRSPETEAASMHSLALLWPDDEANSPDEVDFMEIGDPTRQKVEMFLHDQGGQDHGELEIDATRWHAFAVEWTPDSITNYVDGKQWWKTTDKSHLPRGPMHMTIQLDYFGGPAAEAKEHVDWARQYPPTSGTSPTDGTDATGGGAGSGGSGGAGSPDSETGGSS